MKNTRPCIVPITWFAGVAQKLLDEPDAELDHMTSLIKLVCNPELEERASSGRCYGVLWAVVWQMSRFVIGDVAEITL